MIYAAKFTRVDATEVHVKVTRHADAIVMTPKAIVAEHVLLQMPDDNWAIQNLCLQIDRCQITEGATKLRIEITGHVLPTIIADCFRSGDQWATYSKSTG